MIHEWPNIYRGSVCYSMPFQSKTRRKEEFENDKIAENSKKKKKKRNRNRNRRNINFSKTKSSRSILIYYMLRLNHHKCIQLQHKIVEVHQSTSAALSYTQTDNIFEV